MTVTEGDRDEVSHTNGGFVSKLKKKRVGSL